MPALDERVIHVRLLLLTLNDPYPTPHSALRTDSGPAPSRYVPCETCRRRGEVRVRGGWQLCLLCDGRGWRQRQAGDQPWDAYLEMPLDEAAAIPRESTQSPRRPEDYDDQDLAYGWERMQASYNRNGSYQELRRQLERLRSVAPSRYRLVRTVLVDGEDRRLGREAQLQLDLGVLMLARWMRTVRVPVWLIERSRAADKRETVASLAAEGMSAGAIARRLNIPKGTVRKHLNRSTIPVAGSSLASVKG